MTQTNNTNPGNPDPNGATSPHRQRRRRSSQKKAPVGSESTRLRPAPDRASPGGRRQGRDPGKSREKPEFRRPPKERKDAYKPTPLSHFYRAYKPLCPLCGKVIEDALYALGMGDSGEPAHFDCIMEKLNERHTLAEGEKIIYLGGGTFAVAFFPAPERGKEPGSTFEIRQRIDYEHAVLAAINEWRNKLAVTPSFIVNVDREILFSEEMALHPPVTPESDESNTDQ